MTYLLSHTQIHIHILLDSRGKIINKEYKSNNKQTLTTTTTKIIRRRDEKMWMRNKMKLRENFVCLCIEKEKENTNTTYY